MWAQPTKASMMVLLAANPDGRLAAAREEVLVVDARDSLKQLRQLGFTLIEERELQALGISILRLRPPGSLDSQAGVALLRTAMPQLVADVDLRLRPPSKFWNDLQSVQVRPEVRDRRLPPYRRSNRCRG